MESNIRTMLDAAMGELIARKKKQGKEYPNARPGSMSEARRTRQQARQNAMACVRQFWSSSVRGPGPEYRTRRDALRAGVKRPVRRTEDIQDMPW